MAIKCSQHLQEGLMTDLLLNGCSTRLTERFHQSVIIMHPDEYEKHLTIVFPTFLIHLSDINNIRLILIL